eukprot:CAMPEP_0205885776 /NCGR_PEP_ID=MMETSP1083-20121108/18865_1 /ASSEMBLY_ACC=CAM_ASM_000430 /TAXON_ID=97485 /ORGANISM="Prymnesium parvum, Strain Texoma1" /LENGTH=49 /DNA_ID= /DNA_START= /DNA_END= /DNA_ORIENTATION=
MVGGYTIAQKKGFAAEVGTNGEQDQEARTGPKVCALWQHQHHQRPPARK